jgi:hypothetical protein
MLDDGSCTSSGGKEKRLKNEINQINLVQWIKRFLDGRTI